MHITFVGWGSEQLAITLLAKIVEKEGHLVSLAFSAGLFQDQNNSLLSKIFNETEYVIQKIKENNPDIIAFSPLTISFQWMLKVAKKIKDWDPNKFIVFGGVHVSAVPHIALEYQQIDFVVVGDGESAIVDIINTIREKKMGEPIPSVLYRDINNVIIKGPIKGFTQNIDELPPFTKELWNGYLINDYSLITMASRGCPYRCTFCFNNFYAVLPDKNSNKTPYLRSRSIDHMISELKMHKLQYPKLKYIDFEDDIFTVHKKWLKEFLIRYKKEINLPFTCLSHPKYMDNEIASALKEAGCTWVQIGIQSIDENFKNLELKRYEKNDHVFKSIQYLLQNGLRVKVDQMLGIPGEGIEAQEIARKFYAENCPTKIDTYWTTYLPGTELLKNAINNNWISNEKADKINRGELSLYFNSSLNIENPQLAKMYNGYDLIFKLYPLIPKFLRKRIILRTVLWIPESIQTILKKIFEFIHAFRYQNPEKKLYIKNTVFQSIRILKLKYFNS